MPEPTTPDRPWRCRLCGFAMPVDDVELHRAATAECVCRRCYTSTVGTQLRMDKQWRRRWTDAADNAPA